MSDEKGGVWLYVKTVPACQCKVCTTAEQNKCPCKVCNKEKSFLDELFSYTVFGLVCYGTYCAGGFLVNAITNQSTSTR